MARCMSEATLTLMRTMPTPFSSSFSCVTNGAGLRFRSRSYSPAPAVSSIATKRFLTFVHSKAGAVGAHAPSPVLTVAPQVDTLPPGTPIRVSWTQGADGDTSLLLGCRVAGALGSPVDLDGDGRRVERLRETLGERGVRLAEPDEGSFPVTFGAVGGHADVTVRADADANPVDFATAELGRTAPETV